MGFRVWALGCRGSGFRGAVYSFGCPSDRSLVYYFTLHRFYGSLEVFLTVRLVAHNVSSESGVVLDLGEKRVLWVWGLRLRSLRAV